MKDFWILVKKIFVGLCAKEGCNRAREKYSDYCWQHQVERSREIGQKIADAKFEREVNIHLEALRRFKEEGGW